MTDFNITNGARIEAVNIEGLGAILEAQARNSSVQTSFVASQLSRSNSTDHGRA